MDILLFGGSFDPVHKGHYAILETALEYRNFDKIIIMPVGTPGHKAGCRLPFAARKLLAETAFSKLGVDMEVSSFEGNSTEKSYSYITVDHLKSVYPGAKIFFVIGADSAIDMETWKNWQYLAENVTYLVFARDFDDRDEIQKAVEKIRVYSPDTTVLKSKVVPISSTQLRSMMANGEDFSQWVDSDVEKIIKENSLYAGDYYERNLGTARMLVPLMLREKRAQHTFNVEKLAARLAEKYGVDVKKARLCALLHDIMKQADERIMLHRAGQSDIIERIKDKPVPVLHGFAAADYAYRDMHIEDEDTLMAIKSHTCGRASMSDLEKVIYLADYIEPSRDFPGVEGLRKVCYEDLDRGLLMGLEMTIEEMQNMGNPVHHATVEARDALKG